ncbi:unnamed protein product [Arctia plantaginis]|uniref:Uncharacterized protein n=1 Tax=Arctia plantaginis TaxID=874455 RepID=A0A8S0Z0P4_ARCPL|nr:unnamed protein product [Arctia plantaginis]
MQYTLGDLDAIYTEQQDSSLLLNIEPHQILEQVMTESQEDLDDDLYKPREPQPSVSKVSMAFDSDDSKVSDTSDSRGCLVIDTDVEVDIDVDVDVDVEGDVDVEMDLEIDLPGRHDLNRTDRQQDHDNESD